MEERFGEVMTDIHSWSEIHENRRKIKTLYPKVWDIPLVKREMDRVTPHVREGIRILEIGAGDRRFGKRIKQAFPTVVYKSMDVDPNTAQDYDNLNAVKETFDFIFMFEVIEHLALREAMELLQKIHALLDSGGTLLLSTPNLYHPHRYFDVTHKTPFRYEDLGAILMMAKFDHITFHRMYNDAFLRRIFRLSIGVYFHKYLDVDFARTLLVEGIK